MTYSPPDSVVVERIKRAFPSDELRDRGRAMTERDRKFDFVALFYTLSFGFAAGSDRSLQAFLERYVEMADCDSLSYPSFYEWFSPAFVALLREILDDAIEDLDPGRNDLRGRLEHFRDVLIVDATFISLYQDAKDVYRATGDDQAGLKLHLTESLSTGLPTRFRTTDGATHERSQLPTGEWVADALILFDLGFYDFWLFDRIDANDGWFVSRVKSNANPKVVEELRTWRGNSITLEGKSLKGVLDDLQRQEIDVLVELEFDRKRGSSATATRQFRLVGLLNEDEDEYHLYFTNLPRNEYSAPDIAQLYRARWEVELLFKELKSRFGLDEINTTKPYIIEALVIMAAISLMISREIVDELHKLDAKRREAADADESASRLPPRRGSLAVERHSHLIQLYLMLELGYELPDLDELLLWASQNPNPHRERLRREVESGEFAFDRD
ncbi:IS4 family transposase [Salinarchaeum sp. IM2453]|uniref:IS4 family transposase n=1 Tax=Salinarchaeum sp. IM2453 TaxID=2862870 RepID=UPI001C83C93F|nr:IS4 family transposase [Salinarchaeum sp. IM2453]QZA88273.1 IS4 family transposase [Salinarchaeum sp. IM2453]QZA89130.1 IS4 family transposase [Salinarchaeum sp. IM2453]